MNDPVQPTPPASPAPTPEVTQQPTPPVSSETPPAAPAEPGSLISGESPPKGDEPPTFGVEEVTLDALKGFLPEGVELDEPTATEFTKILNGATSRAELAEKLIEFQASLETKAAEAVGEQWNATQNEWKSAMKADPDIGGDKLEANLAKARTVIETYAPDPTAIKELFALTGAGNHVTMAKFLLAISEALPAEATPVNGEPAPTTPSRAQALFPTTPPPQT